MTISRAKEGTIVAPMMTAASVAVFTCWISLDAVFDQLSDRTLGRLDLIRARKVFEQIAEAIESEFLEVLRARRSDAFK